MIKFTQLSSSLDYPSNHRATLSTLHSNVITYVVDHFQNTNRYKNKVLSVMNTLSYYVLSGDALPESWSPTNPLELESIDSDICKEQLGKLFLHVKNISWDVNESDDIPIIAAKSSDDTKVNKVQQTVKPKPVERVTPKVLQVDTPAEDLYIKPPTYPQFDVNKPWMSAVINQTRYTIYTSIPEIPKLQNQISVTTDVNKMVESDLLKLFPNCMIKTRSHLMYEPCEGMTLDPNVGLIIPIEGFTAKQIRDNIIKYPHLYKLTRLVDDKLVNFYSNIEIDGELYRLVEVWDTLPDSKHIPRNKEFMKEYVVRRYLLERDIKHIKHKYPMYGTLEPFLTLFTTPEEYEKLGYKNPVDLAKKCVESRVSYKQSRNPILRLLRNE